MGGVMFGWARRKSESWAAAGLVPVMVRAVEAESVEVAAVTESLLSGVCTVPEAEKAFQVRVHVQV